MAAEVDSDDVPQFGRLLRQHRMRVGLTQRELADFSTISVRAIRDLEQGRATRPRQDTVRLIADGLRLGPRARAALEVAANRGLVGRTLRETFGATLLPPPLPLDPVVGREAETAVIAGELASGAERLVTIVGLGGTGKTRLALEVAHRLHGEARLPVLWHSFPGTTPCHRPSAGLEGLRGVLERGAEAVYGDEGDGAQSLVELVGDRPALLVLDGADGRVPDPDRMAALLRDCPELRVLVTADRPGGFPAERLFLLSPLECSPGGPAVRLFAELAARAVPAALRTDPEDHAELAADICRRLDGLPLALRAAASWLLVYDLPTLHRCLSAGAAELLEHLAGAEGGSGLREALDRRLRSLPEDGRILLDALCDPGGGFGLADVVALTGKNLPESGRIVRGLLLDGLVRTQQEPDGPPFRVFGLVRACLLLDRRPPAARLPEQLPIEGVARVSHEVAEGANP